MLLSALALLILAACGSDSGTNSNDTEKEDSNGDSATTDKPKSDIKFLSLLTGGTQGTYYALGGTFADLITTETDIKTTAEVPKRLLLT